MYLNTLKQKKSCKSLQKGTTRKTKKILSVVMHKQKD